jgi:hypothetical protein
MKKILENEIVIRGEREGSLSICLDDKGYWLGREGFVSQFLVRVPDADVELLTRLIQGQSWKRLHEYQAELLPWYCPTCRMLHPSKDWLVWDVFDEDGWHDSIRGRCPRGHERLLED